MKIEKGDLVIRRGTHSADVRFVEGIDEESVLLVNSVADLYFEGSELSEFHNQFRLLAKANSLIEEEK